MLPFGSFFPQTTTYSLTSSKDSTTLKTAENAIKNGDPDGIQTLKNDGNWNCNTHLPSGDYPLHLAVRKNKLEIVKILLDFGADDTLKDSEGLDATELATILDRENISLQFFMHKNQINNSIDEIRQKIQETSEKTEELKTKIQIIKKNMKARYQDKESDCLDATDKLYKAFFNWNFPNAVKILDDNNDLIQNKTEDGDTLLHLAVIPALASPEIIEELINRGMDPNQKNNDGQTPLHYAIAAQRNSADLQKIINILKKKTKCDAVDNEKLSTDMMYALFQFQNMKELANRKDPLSLDTCRVLLLLSALLKISHRLHPWNKLLVDSDLFQSFDSWLNWDRIDFNFWKNINPSLGTVASLLKYASCLPPQWLYSPITAALQSWSTSYIAIDALNNLKICWKNRKYRSKKRITANIAIQSARLALVGFMLSKAWDYRKTNP
jgi:ankyrin repeat protein